MPASEIGGALDEYRIDLAARTDGTAQGTAIGTGDRRFAGGIHFNEQQYIHRRQHLREIFEQVTGTCVAMRLEGHYQTALRPGIACGLQRGGDFVGMMTVIVDQQDADRPG